MGRTSKKIQANDIEESEVKQSQELSDASAQKSVSQKIPAYVEKLMHLYPQYEEFWVTPHGCVHPQGMPDYCLKGATLYKNKYFKNNK